jgi:hypothetical protein
MQVEDVVVAVLVVELLLGVVEAIVVLALFDIIFVVLAIVSR